MAESNRIQHVAVVGAGGQLGRFITNALLRSGQHNVTAITRADSTSALPSGVISRAVDYAAPETLVDALRGQDALVVTLSGRAAPDVQDKLVHAAARAGVKWILPNEWSPDSSHPGILQDMPLFSSKVATRELIKHTGTSAYIAVMTGFWYEFCLGNPGNYGFDFAKRTAIFFDQGQTKISTSTWSQIGNAVVALLSLPVENDPATHALSLSQLHNQVVYINSFTVSQEDMLASAMRVTGTTRGDWTVQYEGARERFAAGRQEVKDGNMAGYAKFCARLFFDDGCGDFEMGKGTLNGVLGLPREDLDDATRAAVERQRLGLAH